MKYVVIAILIYLAYLIFKRILKNVSQKQKNKVSGNENLKSRNYDINMIEDAEFREVKGEDKQ
ncbi:MAG: hypothetical protein UZ05_CHB002003199 [Chlorobi bacterium OLB5]|nr:MAG: hypothetical protein UZ05_CHB002003199 [Chlorobi bacterium OLB5]